MIHRFHYLTQDMPTKTHEEQALMACRSGVKWIQLRMKNKDDLEKRAVAKKVKQICSDYNTSLIINDYVSLAKEMDADGVHLGKYDMSPQKARAVLGKNKIIGGTANTFSDILNLHDNVDYLGVGPFKFTTTKQNLSPILGTCGYIDIKEAADIKGVTTPIIAIGGIEVEDIGNIMATGIYGVAISSAVNKAENPSKVIESIINQLVSTGLKYQ